MAYSLTYSFDSTSQSYSVNGYSNITESDIVVIPDTYDDGTNGSHPVTSIDKDSFRGCTTLTSVTIGNSVTSIGNDAFNNCTNLTNVSIPNSVTSFGDYVFNSCNNLQYNVKDNLKYLGNSENPYIYLGNNSETDITTANIDSHCRFISSYAFYNCSGLTSVTIPDSVTRIGSYAFKNCGSLTSIIIPDSVTSIGVYAFLECTSLKSLKLGNGLTSVGFYAFNKCSSLTNVEIPKSLKVITNGMFHSCSNLTSVIIPEGVESIEQNTFAYCEKLTCVVIPESVTGIGKNAFDNCTSLNSIIVFNTTPPTLGSWVFPNNVQFIYVPQSSKEAYKGHTNWKTFADKIVSDNVYLSFVRFNQKNKEYINSELGKKLDKPVNPTADSAVTLLADGTVGTKPLSEIGGGGKLYLHKVEVFFEYGGGTASVVLNNIYNKSNTPLVTQQLLNPYIDNNCGIGCTSNINTPDGAPSSTGTILIDGSLAIIVLVGTNVDSMLNMERGFFEYTNIQDTVTEL